jgi:hypothetical protein
MAQPSPRHWVIITEWQDGTVGTTGPYASKLDATGDLESVARAVADDPEDLIRRTHEQIDVGEDGSVCYVQPMGIPSRQYQIIT